MDKSKLYFPLALAVRAGNLTTVRELLMLGANPNHHLANGKTLMELALAENYIEIVKVLFEHGAKVKSDLLKAIFKMKNTNQVKELLTHFIVTGKYAGNELLQKICHRLIESNYEESLAMEILNLLLNNGLNADNPEHFSILHRCVYSNKYEFVKLLLSRGADVNVKTKLGMTPLHLAILKRNESIAELLLKNRALVNEKTNGGATALHFALGIEATQESARETAHLIALKLLHHDADLNILDNKGRPLLAYSYQCGWFFNNSVKNLAKFSIKFNRPVCNENIEYLQNKNRLKKFEECLEELKRMKEHEVYNGVSLYHIFKMSDTSKRLTSLTRNKNFVTSYWNSWNRQRFRNYHEEVDERFKLAMERKDSLQNEEKKLHSVFKDLLPELIIRKIAYINKQHLFF